MKRIAGVDLPDLKRVDAALTGIYGIGSSNIYDLLDKAKVKKQKRVKDLTEDEVSRIQKIIDSAFKVEGELREEVEENIKRLKQIGAYKGIRHAKNLPVRGQRTRSNARTKRGKRKTIGAMRKEMRAKLYQTKTTKDKK